MRDFTAADFARYHPAGSLGRKLTRVEEAMHTGEKFAERTLMNPFGLSSFGWPDRVADLVPF